MNLLRRFTALALVALMVAGIPAVTKAQSSYSFWLQATDELNNPITSGVTCFVFTSGSDTRETLYSDSSLATALSNPITVNSNGECRWYSSASTAVDVVAYYQTRGTKVRINGVTQYQHRMVFLRQTSAKHVKLPFASAGCLTNECDTGFQIPKGAVLREVFIENNVAVAAAHIAVGIKTGETGGDADGFCAGGATLAGGSATFGRSLETTGFLGCHAVIVTATKLVSPNFYIGAFHSGVLLSRGSVGNDDAGAAGHMGNYIRFPYRGDGVAKTVVYSLNYAGAAGHIHLLFDELHIGN